MACSKSLHRSAPLNLYATQAALPASRSMVQVLTSAQPARLLVGMALSGTSSLPSSPTRGGSYASHITRMLSLCGRNGSL